MSVAATYTLEVDWNGDGSFEADISAHWLHATITHGFSDPLSRVAQVTRATFTLNNASRVYSPPLQSNVVPRRQVKFSITHAGVTAVLFRGFVEDIKPDFGTKRERRAILTCVDAMALLDVHEGPIELQTDVQAHTVIAAEVSAVYTPPATDYQAGITVFPFGGDRWSDLVGYGVGFEEAKASHKILDACVSDWGQFFISKSGAPTYRNRHHLSLDNTTELTLNNSMVGMSYTKRVTSVFNQVEVTCHPRAVGQALEVLGRISQSSPPAIDPGGSQAFVLDYRDPTNQDVALGGKDVLTPVAGTDYVCTDDEAGAGNNVNGDITVLLTAYADKAEVTLTNNGSAIAYIQQLQVRGIGVRVRAPVVMVANDATSRTAYQRRKLPINAPLMSNQSEAQRLAEHLLARYKDPSDEVQGLQIIANTSATFMAAVRDLELLDRVVLTETQTGLASYAGYIYAMTHDIPNKWEHRLTLGLATAYNAGTPFRLDTSALNSGHVLIY